MTKSMSTMGESSASVTWSPWTSVRDVNATVSAWKHGRAILVVHRKSCPADVVVGVVAQRDLEPIPGRYARVTPSKWRRKGRQVPSLVDNPVAVSWVAIPVVDSPAQVFTGPGNDHDVLLPSDLAPGAR